MDQTTRDRIEGMIRQALPLLGMLAISLGWISPEKVGELTASILSAVGPILALAGIIWTYTANSPKSILRSAVKIEAENPKAAKEVKAEVKQDLKDKEMGA